MDSVLIFAGGELLIISIMAAVIWKLKGEDHQSRHLYFGAVVLTALALVFLLAMAMYYWATPEQVDRGKEIFEACIQIIPPILTLVIGFYFGKKSEQISNRPQNSIKGDELKASKFNNTDVEKHASS
tara:strand:+ start:791 stop:1171 length:381 start_codon:yes stop_codon:yes gene_type:complete